MGNEARKQRRQLSELPTDHKAKFRRRVFLCAARRGVAFSGVVKWAGLRMIFEFARHLKRDKEDARRDVRRWSMFPGVAGGRVGSRGVSFDSLRPRGPA